MTTPTDDDLRIAVRRINALASTRIPPYELPGDSFIEEAVRGILLLGQRQGIEMAAKAASSMFATRAEIVTAIRNLATEAVGQ